MVTLLYVPNTQMTREIVSLVRSCSSFPLIGLLAFANIHCDHTTDGTDARLSSCVAMIGADKLCFRDQDVSHDGAVSRILPTV